MVVGGLLLLVAIGIGIAAATSGAFKSTGSGSLTKNGVECNPGEQLAVHYHAHLDILNNGQPVNIPAGIGIDNADNCLYWLHTHDTAGYVHIEAPARVAQRTFTLGNFFDVWGQPLSSQQVATIKLSSGQKLVAFVDGKQYTGDPRSIPLKSKEEIVLEITPPLVDPPPPFTWDDANYPS